MKLVIDIPKGTYEAVRVGTINQVLEYKVWNAIKYGTPLDTVVGQIKWERDVAIQQLQDLGYDLGEKA